MVVLINGGSRGIGAAMVRVFSAAGHQVAFTYKKSESAAQDLAKATGALPIRANSADKAEIFSAVAQAEKAFGSVEILVNNAAISEIGLLSEMQGEAWEEMLRVNVGGYFYYCQAVLPGMIHKKKGSILNISSMWGVVGASCEVAYSATKAAVIGLTKALAKEVAPSGITVNAIAPGVIQTEMNASLGEESLRALAEETPLGRLGTAEEVAKLALFFTGEDASFITGQTILQDGGFSGV